MNPVFERWMLAEAAVRLPQDGRPREPWHAGWSRPRWQAERELRVVVASWQLLRQWTRARLGGVALARSGAVGRRYP